MTILRISYEYFPFHAPVGTWHPRSDAMSSLRRVRSRARPASAGRALELSGCETAVGIDCDAPMAAKLPGRPTDQYQHTTGSLPPSHRCPDRLFGSA
eukprot:4819168-Prymnesium_polylepis.1